jgi:hypothetical protein
MPRRSGLFKAVTVNYRQEAARKKRLAEQQARLKKERFAKIAALRKAADDLEMGHRMMKFIGKGKSDIAKKVTDRLERGQAALAKYGFGHKAQVGWSNAAYKRSLSKKKK